MAVEVPVIVPALRDPIEEEARMESVMATVTEVVGARYPAELISQALPKRLTEVR